MPRYNDFPLDNIHILRLQEASRSLGSNVSLMREDLRLFEQQQIREVQNLQTSIAAVEQSLRTQIAAVQNDVQAVSREVRTLQNGGEINVNAADTPEYILFFLGFITLLVLIVIMLLIWSAEKQKQQSRIHDDKYGHVPVHLVEYVASQLKKKRNLHDLKLELVGKGWTPSVVDHAVDIVKSED